MAVRHPVGSACLCGSVVILILISFLCNSVSSVRLKIVCQTTHEMMTDRETVGRKVKKKGYKLPISYQDDCIIPGLPHDSVISQPSAAFIALG